MHAFSVLAIALYGAAGTVCTVSSDFSEFHWPRLHRMTTLLSPIHNRKLEMATISRSANVLHISVVLRSFRFLPASDDGDVQPGVDRNGEWLVVSRTSQCSHKTLQSHVNGFADKLKCLGTR